MILRIHRCAYVCLCVCMYIRVFDEISSLCREKKSLRCSPVNKKKKEKKINVNKAIGKVNNWKRISRARRMYVKVSNIKCDVKKRVVLGEKILNIRNETSKTQQVWYNFLMFFFIAMISISFYWKHLIITKWLKYFSYLITTTKQLTTQ